MSQWGFLTPKPSLFFVTSKKHFFAINLCIMNMIIRVGQFIKVSRTVPSLCYLALLALDHFSAKRHENTNKIQLFGCKVLSKICPVQPLTSKYPKKGQTLNPLCKLGACPSQQKRPFFKSAWKPVSIKRWFTRNYEKLNHPNHDHEFSVLFACWSTL